MFYYGQHRVDADYALCLQLSLSSQQDNFNEWMEAIKDCGFPYTDTVVKRTSHLPYGSVAKYYEMHVINIGIDYNVPRKTHVERCKQYRALLTGDTGTGSKEKTGAISAKTKKVTALKF